MFHPLLFYTFASTKQVRTRCTSTGKPKSHIRKQLTVSLVLYETYFHSEKPMLWQNRNEEGVSSRLS